MATPIANRQLQYAYTAVRLVPDRRCPTSATARLSRMASHSLHLCHATVRSGSRQASAPRRCALRTHAGMGTHTRQPAAQS